MTCSADSVLLLTVGTGDADRLEETLFRPLLQSMTTGDWNEVVLLPSTVTRRHADAVRARGDGPMDRIRVEPLPNPGMEDDADACFAHFDAIICRLRSRGVPDSSIRVDFTRGTKAMSAALVLAATRHGVPTLRYLRSRRRDQRGMAIPGQEDVGEFSTRLVTASLTLDRARNFIERGLFAAAAHVLPDPTDPSVVIPGRYRQEARQIRSLARCLAAWDRLHYRRAHDRAACLGDSHRDRAVWISELAAEPENGDHAARSCWLRRVACDLLENGRRRLNQRHFEDSLVRGYRVRELIGQFLLFDYGLDTAALDPEHEEVRKLRERLRNKGEHDFVEVKRGSRVRLTAGRELAARLLKQIDPCRGARLLEFDGSPAGEALRDRNHSILIHGFQVQAPDADALDGFYRELETLLRAVAPEATRMILWARDTARVDF